MLWGFQKTLRFLIKPKGEGKTKKMMPKIFKHKKAYTIADIPWIAITFGTGVIVLSIVAQIVGDVKSTQTSDTYEYNVSLKGQEGLYKIANWLPTIGLVLGAVIVIVALAVLFTMRFQR